MWNPHFSIELSVLQEIWALPSNDDTEERLVVKAEAVVVNLDTKYRPARWSTEMKERCDAVMKAMDADRASGERS